MALKANVTVNTVTINVFLVSQTLLVHFSFAYGISAAMLKMFVGRLHVLMDDKGGFICVQPLIYTPGKQATTELLGTESKIKDYVYSGNSIPFIID